MILGTEGSRDSILGILLDTKPVETLLIQIYMPTSDCEEQVSLEFYEEIEKVIGRLGGRQSRVVIVMGDFNAMVGDSEVDGIVGAFSKGQLLLDYCREKKFTIRSTQYQTAKKRRFIGHIQVAN